MAPRIWSSAVTRKAAAPTERRCRISGSGDDGGRPCVGRPIAPATPDLIRGPAGCRNQWCLEKAGSRIKSGMTKEWLVRSEEHTSKLQSLMRTSYAVFCLKKKKTKHKLKQTNRPTI